MKQKILEIEKPALKKDIPNFSPGDTVRVAVRIFEGDKERLQQFEGVCISRRGGGIRETFTLRRVSYGVGIERIFQLHSPRMESIKVVRRGKVRRSKLYYLRHLRGKKAKISEATRLTPEEKAELPTQETPAQTPPDTETQSKEKT